MFNCSLPPEGNKDDSNVLFFNGNHITAFKSCFAEIWPAFTFIIIITVDLKPIN